MKKIILSTLILLVAFSSCEKNDNISSEDSIKLVTIGDDSYRPEFHFSPNKNWMNDPNGMVYYKGEYHLFYQYNPNDIVWGPMHWGHAVTSDLINWKELPIALYPDDLGNIFSGSIVVDENNTTGFKNGDESPLVAIFTHQNPSNNNQTQSLAYSNDKGRSWVKYKNNPVLENSNKADFRDPKVSWNEESKKWVMVVAAGDEILFYDSVNLKDWELKSNFGIGMGAHGGVWECPDLFKIKDNKGQEMWALLVSINPGGPNGGSGTQYFLGDFNGETFTTSQSETLWLDYGTDNYAGVTWSNEPHNRNLFMGWMSNWVYAQDVPTRSYRSAMTFPRTLHWKDNNGKNIITSKLPDEFIHSLGASVADNSNAQNGFELLENSTLAKGTFFVETMLDFENIIDAEIVWGNGTENIFISYNKNKDEFKIDRSKSGFNFNNLNGNSIVSKYILPNSKKLKIELLVDKSSIELFVNDGELVLTSLVFFNAPFNNFSISSNSSEKFIESIKINQLKK